MAVHLLSRVLNLTRTADVVAYTAGDVIGSSASAGGAVLSFPSSGGNGKSFVVNGSELRIDLNAIPSGMTSLRLYLYSATPPSNLADNAAWDLPAGDASVFLGYVDLGTPVDLGSTLYVQAVNLGKAVRVREDSTLFGYLVTIAGYTPASGTTHQIVLHAEGY